MKKAFNIVKNKFVIAGLAFIVWMLFFDRNDLATLFDYGKELNELKKEKNFYITENERVGNELKALTSDKKKLQQFAREKYMMKKDNEDIFILIEEREKK
ncbi:FtsB family cell division protein [Olivibacter sitiensis]|uniref:FtsB family cell division protein n=1 Tax=Olivibacter sitiensis TaxID=376470 RepID=UPI000416E18A|nr:septum formation initiator family protein [Olivibacter sitiensis]